MKSFVKYIILSLLVLLTSCDYYNKMLVKQDQYQGVIVNKFNDLEYHNVRTFEIKENKNTAYETTTCFPNSWEYAEVGDSIIKMKGKLYFTIKKKNGDLKDFYFYP